MALSIFDKILYFIMFPILCIGSILSPQTTDPVSGFFGIKRNLVLNTHDINSKCGYKILLEFLSKCKWNRVTELPYVFTNRKLGKSKLKGSTIGLFIKQLIDDALFPGRAQEELHKIFCFGIVGITGIGVNMLSLIFFKNYLPLIISSFIAIELSIISNFVLNDMWTFRENNNDTWLHRMLSYNSVAFGGMIINMVVLAILALFGVWYILANLVGIMLGFTWNFLGNRHSTWKET